MGIDVRWWDKVKFYRCYPTSINLATSCGFVDLTYEQLIWNSVKSAEGGSKLFCGITVHDAFLIIERSKKRFVFTITDKTRLFNHWGIISWTRVRYFFFRLVRYYIDVWGNWLITIWYKLPGHMVGEIIKKTVTRDKTPQNLIWLSSEHKTYDFYSIKSIVKPGKTNGKQTPN